MKEKEQENIEDIKEKVCKIYHEAFDRLLQAKAMLKCLEIACNYDDNLTAKEIMLFVEVVSQKMEEIDNYIDKFSVI